MIYKGRNLIICADGQAVAASKSCSVDVSCDTQKVSSPDDGQWENSIPGRKKWSISTNQLLVSSKIITRSVTVESVAANQQAVIRDVEASGTQHVSYGGNRGISVVVMIGGTSALLIGTYDTYTSDTAVSSLVSSLNSLTPDSESEYFILCSNGQIRLTADIKNVLVNRWGVNAADIPSTFSGFGALSMIGAPAWGSKNIFNFCGTEGGRAESKLFYDQGIITTDSVLKDSVAAVGAVQDVRVNVPGLVSETMHGRAICKSFKVSGAVGNLLQGSFAFEGTGPLQ